MKSAVFAALLPFDRRVAILRAPVERVLRSTGHFVMRWLDARRERANLA